MIAARAALERLREGNPRFTSDVRRLGPGETVPFTTETDSVPADAANVSILFTNPDDTR